ncbi:MAG TPA: peptidylprolyl isomerase [Verrucomicrobiota bacterium]|nr:peptidylprolyl isomerase [Verrucomicrobiota bacterium]HQL80069.1 peptidylprolyl isomerase [Verrucomicrobiota bacterium]
MVARLVMPAVLGLSTLIANGQGNGIFADFSTSMGSFTCQLDYTNAPRMTANFIGLATGQRAWLDLTTGRARTNAFYNGLTFHRVIGDFMNQGGSPNGLGTDGPGYALKNEFSPQLVFDRFGVLAMANSGPNSDGAQFFITVAPFTSGNNTYSIFGRVVSGSNVVYAINHVATGANDKPLTNVIIQQVNIRRVGTAALAFNINAQGLPIVTNLPLRIAALPGQVSLTFSNRQYADNQLYSATNLAGAWTADALGIEITAPVSNSVRQAKDAPRKFFRLAQVQYASSTFAPKTMYGRTLTLTFTSGLTGTLTIGFNSTGGGDYTFPPYSPGIVTSYAWTQEPYRGFIWPIYFSGLVPLTVRLDFSSNTSGTFSGTFYAEFPFSVAGPFSLAGP